MDSMSNQTESDSRVDKIVNRVREFRENKLMTQAQLARKAKVALRTIHSVEKGMNCRMDTKRKILLALGLRFEDKELVFPSTWPRCSACSRPARDCHRGAAYGGYLVDPQRLFVGAQLQVQARRAAERIRRDRVRTVQFPIFTKETASASRIP